jgi:hypothetical protein
MGYAIIDFDISSVPDGATCVFVGQRGSGKTFAATDLLYHKRNAPIVRVISATETGNGSYSPYVPPCLISERYEAGVVTSLVDRQKTLAERAKSDTRIANMDRSAVLVFDDIGYAVKEWQNSEAVREIMSNGRHWLVTFIVLLQYGKMVDPSIRVNFDYVFLCPSVTGIASLYDTWGKGVFDTFKEFKECFEYCTGGGGCMVIRTRMDRNNLERGAIFRYNAKDNGPFKTGLPAWWNIAKSESTGATSTSGRFIFK